MRRFGMAAVLMLWAPACGTSGSESGLFAPPLESGAYRLELDNAWYWFPGPLLSLAPDGSFTGHPSSTLWECEGSFDSAQLDELTAALNDAHALARTDMTEPCDDHAIYLFDIEVTSGSDEGRSNSFRYEICTDDGDPALNEVLVVALGPLNDLFRDGACTGCPRASETRDDECYGHEVGSARLCLGRTSLPCDETTAGQVVECKWEGLFECDAQSGWIPVI